MKTKPTIQLLNVYTRKQLREIAKEAGIKRGRNKIDTINNLLKHSNKINLTVSPVIELI